MIDPPARRIWEGWWGGGADTYFNVDLSLEFLMGRALDNAMLNVGLKDVARRMLISSLGIHSIEERGGIG